MAEETRLRRFARSDRRRQHLAAHCARAFRGGRQIRRGERPRIYGDFSSPRMKSWIEILPKYAIDPYQQFAYTVGKNASDIGLVIERDGSAA